MNWFSNFISSSLGKKVIMSLTGLFLIVFLKIHLLGNLQLLKDDGGEAFNTYAYLMTHNTLIKSVSYGLYFFILLHSFVGISLWLKNRKSKGQKYAVSNHRDTTWASKNMALLGTLILAFIFIHMGDFWYKMKFTDQLNMAQYAGVTHEVKDLYTRVAVAFTNPGIVAAYVIGMIVLAFHLWHGFASAFQTLGLNHKKWTPIIEFLGKVYAIVVPVLFALIPIYFYFTHK
ncbi:MAG TPA: succinate dehydrogenase cytochrome b subunit [Saprospiraceae bacterium]|nr:succinate dehydrogenase cytochrome b subunit [Saprospiraceae bacterium]